MDNYLASGKLKEANNFVLNITFELLKGCVFNCRGCHVNKDGQEAFGAEESEKFFDLLDSFMESDYRPFIAFVGPTDFLVAENTISVLNDPKAIEILREFKRLSFQSTFLNVDSAKAVAETLNKHFSDREIEVNLVVDPSRIMDERYLGILQKNKNRFLEELGRDDVRAFGIMNVYDYDQTKLSDMLKDYEFMHKQVDDLFETTIDFNFSIGRKPNLEGDEFLSAVTRVKELFNQSVVTDEKAQYLRFSFGKLTDSLIEKQYNYLGGELYFSPLLYERYASFDPAFKIPMENNNVRDVELYENIKVSEQYSVASEMDECESCEFLGSCVDRGILFLMKNYGVKKCLVAKDALKVVNNL